MVAMRFVFVKVLFLACLLCATHIADSQVTFSRDWNAGKRSSLSDTSPECSSALRMLSSLMANTLLKNLHQLSYCDLKPIFHAMPEDSGNIFSPSMTNRL